MKKQHRHIILFLLCFVLSLATEAQEEWLNAFNASDSITRYKSLIDKTDDLEKKVDYQLQIAMYAENLNHRKKAYDQAHEYAHQLNDTALMVVVLGEKATALCIYGELDNGLMIFDSIMLNYRSFYEDRNLAMHQFQYGKFLINSNRLYDALEVIHESLAYFEKEGVSNYNRLLIGSLGSIYSRLERYDEALDMYTKAIQISKQIGFKSGAWNNYLHKSTIQSKRKEFDKASLNIDTAFSLIDTVPSMHWAYLDLYLYKAKLESSLGNYKKSNKLLDEKFDRVKRDEDNTLLARYYLQYGFNFNHLGQFQNALKNSRQALRIASENNYTKTKCSALLEIAKGLEGLGLHEGSIKSFKAYQSLSDSLDDLKIKSNVNQLASKYQLLKVEQEKQKLESENNLKSIKLERNKERNFVFLAFILGLILFAGTILYFLRRKTHLNTQLADKNQLINKSLDEKNILLREIHHRVKNNLQVISSLLNLQSNYISDDLALKAITEGKNRVNSMALIHQKLYQEKNLTGINTQDYFTDLVESLCDTYDISESEINIISNIEPLLLDVDTMIPLGLITNELVSNALKHAFDDTNTSNREIRISLQETNNSLRLCVADNGKGIDKESFIKSKSFGNKLIQAFLPKLEADLNISEGLGTEFEFIVNKYEKAA